ncbi:MAG: class I SAM-dependent rRNA methyltransferase [Planctomycetes bacterium]|nr:class I SAM-dependent rRNA methyltransferase [Planctomycetota bacterium]
MPDEQELAIGGEAASLVAAGYPFVSLREASGREPASGRVVRLVSPAGKWLAHAVADPGAGILWTIAGREERSFEEALAARFAGALRAREALFAGGATDAFCLFHGEGDGASGLVLERFGKYGVLYVYSRALLDVSELLARLALEEAGLEGIVRKLRLKGKDREEEVHENWYGRKAPGRLEVREEGVPFEVHLPGALNVGLFTDMREIRRRFGALSRDRTVLNLFAYTGSFSVVAAKSGASTTNIDLSSGALGWAEDNFRLSGLDPKEHEFAVQDALHFLKGASRRGRTWETVLVDPPTFSESRRGGFVYKRDFPLLVRLSMEVLAPGGLLWLASNMRSLRPGSIDKWVGQAAAELKRRIDVLEVFGLPADRPTPLSYPEGRYLHVLALRAS